MAAMLRTVKIYSEKPALKAAIFIFCGIIFSKLALTSLRFDLVFLLIILVLLNLKRSNDNLKQLRSLLYILSLILIIGMNMKVKERNLAGQNEIELAGNQIIQISSVFRKRIAKGNRKNTYFASGVKLYSKKAYKRIRQPLGIVFKQNVPDFEYGSRIMVSGQVAGLKKWRKSKKEVLLIKNAWLIESELSWYSWFKNRVYELKGVIRQIFKENIDVPVDDLESAFLIGERANLGTKRIEKFRQAGVMHVLAISGLHLGLIMGFFILFLKLMKIPKNHQMYCLLIVLVIYVHLVNFKPSVVRASLMAIIIICGVLIKRPSDLLNTLGAVVCIVGLTQPAVLLNASMQLSIVATFFIICVLVPSEKILFKQYYYTKTEKWVIRLVLVTVSAWAGVAPLIAWYFNEINGVGLIASLLVVPLVGCLLFMGFSLVIISMISKTVALMLGKVIFYTGNFTLEVIEIFSKLDAFRFTIFSPPIVVIILYYILVLVFFNWLHERAAEVKVISMPYKIN